MSAECVGLNIVKVASIRIHVDNSKRSRRLLRLL